MKKLLATILLSSVLLVSTLQVKAEGINIQSEGSILMDAKTGQVLYEKDADTQLYPASTTKVMTAVMALENGNLKQLMTASKAAVLDIGKDGMNIGIQPGEQLYLEDLLNAMLIRSANETANIIAENLCSTRQEFIDKMNQRVKELGATGTHFVNPCGAHEKDHYSTARDMAKIAQYAMTFPEFRKIVERRSYRMPPTNMHPSDDWGFLGTTNKLLRDKVYESKYYSKVLGIKTGFTSQAGNNLLAAASDDTGMELISVVMGVKNQGSDAVWIQSKQLLEYGFKNFTEQNLVIARQVKKQVQVGNAQGDAALDLVAEQDLKTVLPIDKEQWKLEETIEVNQNIQAPIQRGDVLGKVKYSRNGTALGQVNLVASAGVQALVPAKTEVDKKEKRDNNNILLKILYIALGIVAGFFVLRFSLQKVSKFVRMRRG